MFHVKHPDKEAIIMTTTYRSYTDRMEVTVPEGEVNGLRVERFEIPAFSLENLRMARDGRGSAPGWYTKLIDVKTGTFWMSDTTAERQDHKEPVAHIQLGKAKTVLINGLGLGMVLQAALTYDHVERVDVIEKDERVIKLVGPHYTRDPRVNIIHADAYQQIKAWPRSSRWDVAWSDIWEDWDPRHIPFMDTLHKYYRRRTQWHGCWARQLALKERRAQLAEEAREAEFFG